MDAWKKIGRDCSPIYHVTDDLPPTLIYHGDADTLVPLEQSEWFRSRAEQSGGNVKIVVHPGGEHGWLTMITDIRKFADWFDEHLRVERIATDRAVPTENSNLSHTSHSSDRLLLFRSISAR